MAMITRLRMVPVYAIISMWKIWADGHLKALDYIQKHTGASAFNLGTGKGYSVLEVVKAFEKVSGQEVPYVIAARRAGDVAVCYADPAKANRELGWQANYESRKCVLIPGGLHLRSRRVKHDVIPEEIYTTEF